MDYVKIYFDLKTMSESEINSMTENECKEFFRNQKWPNGIFCYSCGYGHVYLLNDDNHYYKCARVECRKKGTLLSQTIMHNSKVSLKQWLLMFYYHDLSTSKLSSITGLTQKSCWSIKSRIESVLYKPEKILSNDLTSDITKSELLSLRLKEIIKQKQIQQWQRKIYHT